MVGDTVIEFERKKKTAVHQMLLDILACMTLQGMLSCMELHQSLSH